MIKMILLAHILSMKQSHHMKSVIDKIITYVCTLYEGLFKYICTVLHNFVQVLVKYQSYITNQI